ncbi:transporter protein [Arthrobacter sp. Hiyo6]|nr:transporter protein [Arthrobacter sp. Hiyo6]
MWVIAKKLKETPQFELHHKLTELEKSGQSADAHSLARAYGVEHSSAAPLKRIWEPHLRRNTIVFSLAWIFNFFGILIFSILGSSVLKNAKGVELSDAFWMLIVINMLAYFATSSTDGSATRSAASAPSSVAGFSPVSPSPSCSAPSPRARS